METNDCLEEVIAQLASLKPSSGLPICTETYIPLKNEMSHKRNYKLQIYSHMDNISKCLAKEQSYYDDVYVKNLHKRKEYVTNAINKIESEISNKNIDRIKELKSQIDFLKSQVDTCFDTITVNSEDTKKIYLFLSTLDLKEEYTFMEEFLLRKIRFELQTTTPVEIASLKKLLKFIESSML